jgi:hypothetical protein
MHVVMEGNQPSPFFWQSLAAVLKMQQLWTKGKPGDAFLFAVDGMVALHNKPRFIKSYCELFEYFEQQFVPLSASVVILAFDKGVSFMKEIERRRRRTNNVVEGTFAEPMNLSDKLPKGDWHQWLGNDEFRKQLIEALVKYLIGKKVSSQQHLVIDSEAGVYSSQHRTDLVNNIHEADYSIFFHMKKLCCGLQNVTAIVYTVDSDIAINGTALLAKQLLPGIAKLFVEKRQDKGSMHMAVHTVVEHLNLAKLDAATVAQLYATAGNDYTPKMAGCSSGLLLRTWMQQRHAIAQCLNSAMVKELAVLTADGDMDIDTDVYVLLVMAVYVERFKKKFDDPSLLTIYGKFGDRRKAYEYVEEVTYAEAASSKNYMPSWGAIEFHRLKANFAMKCLYRAIDNRPLPNAQDHSYTSIDRNKPFSIENAAIIYDDNCIVSITGGNSPQSGKSCSCKKSACKSKQCGCVSRQQSCTMACKCLNCKNGPSAMDVDKQTDCAQNGASQQYDAADGAIEPLNDDDEEQNGDEEEDEDEEAAVESSDDADDDVDMMDETYE